MAKALIERLKTPVTNPKPIQLSYVAPPSPFCATDSDTNYCLLQSERTMAELANNTYGGYFIPTSIIASSDKPFVHMFYLFACGNTCSTIFPAVKMSEILQMHNYTKTTLMILNGWTGIYLAFKHWHTYYNIHEKYTYTKSETSEFTAIS